MDYQKWQITAPLRNKGCAEKGELCPCFGVSNASLPHLLAQASAVQAPRQRTAITRKYCHERNSAQDTHKSLFHSWHGNGAVCPHLTLVLTTEHPCGGAPFTD